MSYPEKFISIFARNCEVRRIESAVAKSFLEGSHRYGWSKCRFCYGLFVKRQGGGVADRCGQDGFIKGTLVAVATFSNARRWKKDEKVVSSYEWVRYASLQGVRVLGGMGKMLQTFVEEVHPDDVMSYAPVDNCTAGDVYLSLGFTLEGEKEFEGGKSLKFRKKFNE